MPDALCPHGFGATRTRVQSGVSGWPGAADQAWQGLRVTARGGAPGSGAFGAGYISQQALEPLLAELRGRWER